MMSDPRCPNTTWACSRTSTVILNKRLGSKFHQEFHVSHFPQECEQASWPDSSGIWTWVWPDRQLNGVRETAFVDYNELWSQSLRRTKGLHVVFVTTTPAGISIQLHIPPVTNYQFWKMPLRTYLMLMNYCSHPPLPFPPPKTRATRRWGGTRQPLGLSLLFFQTTLPCTFSTRHAPQGVSRNTK